jgi:NhaP-type Na+/H+ or K+/H+ antiporter
MSLTIATQILTNIALILLIGLLVGLVAKRLKVAHILLLLLTGLVIGKLSFGEIAIFSFSDAFLIAMAVLTLVMIVFDGASRFEWRNVDIHSVCALKVTLYFMFFNIILVSLLTVMFFLGDLTIPNFLFAMLFSILVSGTDPGSIFILLNKHAIKAIEFLKIESIINTPLIVILPLILIDLISNLSHYTVTEALIDKFIPFLKLIIVGVGTGVVLGIVFFKSMRKVYSQTYSPIALITAALLAYSAAENLEGSGVLAVATLGLFFGSMYVKEKSNLQEFSSMLGNTLVILVFVLIGMLIKIDFVPEFMLKAVLIFFVLILTRAAAIFIGLKNANFSFKEKVFMTLSMPKGIAVAVVIFTLSVLPIADIYQPMMQIILQLTTLIMIYSLICSSIIDRFSKWFIKVKLFQK